MTTISRAVFIFTTYLITIPKWNYPKPNQTRCIRTYFAWGAYLWNFLQTSEKLFTENVNIWAVDPPTLQSLKSIVLFSREMRCWGLSGFQDSLKLLNFLSHMCFPFKRCMEFFEQHFLALKFDKVFFQS